MRDSEYTVNYKYMVPFSGMQTVQRPRERHAWEQEWGLGFEKFEVPRLLGKLVQLWRCKEKGFEGFKEGLKGSAGGYLEWPGELRWYMWCGWSGACMHYMIAVFPKPVDPLNVSLIRQPCHLRANQRLWPCSGWPRVKGCVFRVGSHVVRLTWMRHLLQVLICFVCFGYWHARKHWSIKELLGFIWNYKCPWHPNSYIHSDNTIDLPIAHLKI